MGKSPYFLQLMDYEVALFYPRLSNGRVGHFRVILRGFSDRTSQEIISFPSGLTPKLPSTLK